MRNKISVVVLGFLALVFVCGATGGCGERFYDDIEYQYPNWTPEGLVYCQKSVTHRREYGGGYHETFGTDYYYVTMDTNGNNETTLPYNNYPYFSPLGTYVALISGETISIVRRADNTQVYSFSPTIESISELDWGPDEGELVYMKNRGGINVVNVDGTGDLNIAASGEVMSWKYGERIAFLFLDGLVSRFALINSDGTNRVNFSNGNGVGNPKISEDEHNYIFGTSASTYLRMNVSNITTPEYTTLLNSFNGYLPQLSYNETKIIYGKFRETGIWLIDVDGSNLTQLK